MSAITDHRDNDRRRRNPLDENDDDDEDDNDEDDDDDYENQYDLYDSDDDEDVDETIPRDREIDPTGNYTAISRFERIFRPRIGLNIAYAGFDNHLRLLIGNDDAFCFIKLNVFGHIPIDISCSIADNVSLVNYHL